MSLFSRIGNIIHNDVVKPVQRATQQPQRPQAPPNPRVNAQQLMAALQAGRMQQQAPPQVHPSFLSVVGHDVAQRFGNDLRNTQQALRPAGNVAQSLTRSVPEILATATGKTYHPGAGAQRVVFGKQPVQPVQQDVRGVYRAVKAGGQTLPGNIPIPQHLAPEYAAATAVLHALQDVPVAGSAIKGGLKLGKDLAPVAKGLADARVPLDAVGGAKPKNIPVIKNIKPTAEQASLDKTAPAMSIKEVLKNKPEEIVSPQTPAQRQSEADANVWKSLSNGGTKNEAIQHYQEQLGLPMKQARQRVNIVQRTLNMRKAGPNPLSSEVGLPHAPNSNAAILNANAAHDMTLQKAGQAIVEGQKLSAHDTTLLDNLRGNNINDVVKQAQDKPQFNKVAQLSKHYNDFTQALGSKLSQEVPYRQNYGARQFFNLEDENSAKALADYKASLPDTPGYSNPRSLTYKEAEGLGIKRLHSNFLEDLQHDSTQRASDLQRLALKQGLSEAHPGKIAEGEILKDSQTGQPYHQLTIRGGEGLSTPKDIASQINRRSPVEDATGALGKYDSVNAFMKYLKLSGGAFHAFTEGGNFVGQQLASGKLFTEPASTGKVFKVFMSPKALNKEVQGLEQDGTFDKARLGGLTWTPKAIKADVDVTPHSKLATVTGIKALHDATFQRELPYIKLKMFQQKTANLDPNNPEDLAQIRDVARGINRGIGGINRTVEGMTPKQAKLASRLLLATDFTEGKIRTVGAALTKGGQEGKLARQLIAGKALVFAGLASAGGALAGEYDGKSPTEIAANILGNFVNPTFETKNSKVSFPATHISEFTKPFLPFVNGSKDKFSGLKNYGTDRLAAIPSEVNQLANNLDYTGNHIYGKNTKKNGGKPFTPAQTGINVAKGVLPIPFSQGTAAVQGKQSPIAAAGNIAGLRVTPKTAPTAKSQEQPSGNKDGKGLTKKQKIALSPDSSVRWAGLSTKAKKNVQASNPDKYIAEQSKVVQTDLAKGKKATADKDAKTVKFAQVFKGHDPAIAKAYQLGTTDFEDFVSSANPTTVNQLRSLDNQLLNAGAIKTSKFTKAINQYASDGGSTGSSNSSGKKSSGATKTAKIATLKLGKLPKTVKVNISGINKPVKTKRTKISFKKLGAPKQKKIRIA